MLRRMYVDIEVGSTNPKLQNVFPDPKVARHNIISIVAYDNYSKKYHIFLYRDDLEQKLESMKIKLSDKKGYTARYYQTDDERNLILAFSKFWNIKQFDFIHGWNSDNFDIPYLLSRARNLDIYGKVCRNISATGDVRINYNYTDIPGCKSFDLMRGAKKILGRYVEGSLQSVSMLKLGFGKLGDTVSAISAWRYDLQRLIDYNIRDVELTVLLDNKMSIFSFFKRQVEMTGSDYITSLTANYKVLEQFIRYNKHLHTKMDDFMVENIDVDKQEKFDGAIVLDAHPGIENMIAVQDLTMMYPNIILSGNMSPETIIKKVRCSDKEYYEDMPENIRKYHCPDSEWEKMNPIEVNGVFFRTDFEGFVPRCIREQVELRYEIERDIDAFAKEYGPGFEKTEEFETLMEMRVNVKGLINAWFGVFGFKDFFLYDYLIAKSVTYLGVKQLEWSRDFVKREYGIDTKYGDTDSIFIDTPQHIADHKLIVDVLDKVYQLEFQLKKVEDPSLINAKIEMLKRSIDEELEKTAKFHGEIGDAITKSYDDFVVKYNIKNHSFSMKFEKLYAKLFFAKPKNPNAKQKKLNLAAKKRYSGLLVYKDGKPVWKLDVVGFSVKRSDTAKVTVNCQKKALKTIIFNKVAYNDLYRIIRGYYLRVGSGKAKVHDVGIPKGFGSELRRYKKKNRNFRWYAADWSNRHLGTNYGKGNKPRGVALQYMPPPWNQFPLHNKHKHNWIAFDDEHPLREDFYPVIDWKFMANMAIIEPMKSIYESVGIKTSDLRSGTKKVNTRKGF